jgi:hypothetical protein
MMTPMQTVYKHSESKGKYMRIHDGDLAYDLEQPIDPQTQLRSKWRFTLYRVKPTEEKLGSGDAHTRVEAEKKAKLALARLKAKLTKAA